MRLSAGRESTGYLSVRNVSDRLSPSGKMDDGKVLVGQTKRRHSLPHYLFQTDLSSGTLKIHAAEKTFLAEKKPALANQSAKTSLPRTNEPTKEQRKEWTNERKNEQTNKRINERGKKGSWRFFPSNVICDFFPPKTKIACGSFSKNDSEQVLSALPVKGNCLRS